MRQNGHSSNGSGEEPASNGTKNPPKISFSMQETLSQWIRMSRLEKGKRIFDDDSDRCFYLIRNGLLGIYKRLSSDNSILVEKIVPGQSIGVTQMMLEQPFPAHVRAIKGSIVLRGNQEDLEKIKRDFKPQIRKLLLEESRFYTSIYERIQNNLSESVEQQIARELLDLADQIGRDTAGGLEIVVGLTRKEIAGMVGCSHESASRVMSDWEKEGTISTEHKYITLRKPDKLRSVFAQPP